MESSKCLYTQDHPISSWRGTICLAQIPTILSNKLWVVKDLIGPLGFRTNLMGRYCTFNTWRVNFSPLYSLASFQYFKTLKIKIWTNLRFSFEVRIYFFFMVCSCNLNIFNILLIKYLNQVVYLHLI